MIKQINTAWKLIFMGLTLGVGAGLFVGVSAAADDVKINENYYDFECDSGTTIPLNQLESTHSYLIDDDSHTVWSGWTSTNRYDGQTVSWGDTQTVESVYYFVDNIPANIEVMFTFTAGSQMLYKSINSTSNGTWMQVPFDSIDASSLYIERVDETGEDMIFYEMRVCVTAETTCNPSNLAINMDDPDLIMVNPDTGERHYAMKTFIFNLDGDFTGCALPPTTLAFDGVTCATGEILSLSDDSVTVRFRKHRCFTPAVVDADMDSGPPATLTIGNGTYDFDLRLCPNSESVYFIN